MARSTPRPFSSYPGKGMEAVGGRVPRSASLQTTELCKSVAWRVVQARQLSCTARQRLAGSPECVREEDLLLLEKSRSCTRPHKQNQHFGAGIRIAQ
jgi:hypothetical protein